MSIPKGELPVPNVLDVRAAFIPLPGIKLVVASDPIYVVTLADESILRIIVVCPTYKLLLASITNERCPISLNRAFVPFAFSVVLEIVGEPAKIVGFPDESILFPLKILAHWTI